MQIAPLPTDEAERLQELRSYGVLDTQPEQAFDDITEIARALAETPVAIVSLVDENRQWFKSCLGLDAQETPRNVAFCSHAILQRTPLIVPDALKDPRFADNPLVVAPPHIRFYAGFPLISANGLAVGTLCVIDFKPNAISDGQCTLLQRLARQVVRQMELSRQAGSLRQAEAELSQQACPDRADGMEAALAERFLPKAVFDDTIDLMLELPAPPSFSLLNIKLRDLGRVAATLGHRAGEQLFQQWGQGLLELLPATASCCRSSESEVLVLLPHLSQRDTVLSIAEAVIAFGERGLHLDTHRICVPMAIGAAISMGNYKDAASLEADSRLAQQAARANSGSQVRFIDLLTRVSAMRQMSVEADLRQAIAEQRLEPWAQPIVRLEDGHWCGMEMLVRWPQPGNTPLQPADFLPAAERAGLLAEIDLLMLERSLQLLGSQPPWVGEGLLSVNLSSALLSHGEARRTWLQLLENTQLPPGWRIQAEIVEDALQLDMDPIEAFIGELIRRGVRVALDDFGTGYSSLSRLHYFSMHMLKVDRSFVTRINSHQHSSNTLLEMMARMAETLGMELTAEGIETAEQADWLRRQGYNHGQGYVFGRPMPWPEFLEAARLATKAP